MGAEDWKARHAWVYIHKTTDFWLCHWADPGSGGRWVVVRMAPSAPQDRRGWLAARKHKLAQMPPPPFEWASRIVALAVRTDMPGAMFQAPAVEDPLPDRRPPPQPPRVQVPGPSSARKAGPPPPFRKSVVGAA